MVREIKRDVYLQRLIDKKENGLIKVITGIRRCGKSYLLFYIYHDYLISQGVDEKQIIQIPLDDDLFTKYRDPTELSKYIRSKIEKYVASGILYDLVDLSVLMKLMDDIMKDVAENITSNSTLMAIKLYIQMLNDKGLLVQSDDI